MLSMPRRIHHRVRPRQGLAATLARLAAIVASTLVVGACGHDPAPSSVPLLTASAWFLPDLAPEERTCRLRVRNLMQKPDLGGTPAFDQHRADLLGRARGEPVVFVREPRRIPEDQMSAGQRAAAQGFDRGRPGVRVVRLARALKHDPEVLRSVLLPEGYVYASDPHDALALVRVAVLPSLFKEPIVWLHRRNTVYRLERATWHRTTIYRYADGAHKGQEAQLIFGDRVAASPGDLAAPLHRDLRALALEEGFDRVRFLRRTDSALVADLRFGDAWVHTVIDTDGAAARVSCLAESKDTVDRVQAWKQSQAFMLRARAAMEATVDAQVDEALIFDRPLDAPDHFQDGQLRPAWRDAYFRGQTAFGYEGRSYPVFLTDGRPRPPQVCVDLVFDTYERTAGTWFTSRGERPERRVGRLDFNDHGVVNRRGVIAFGLFAESHPDLFSFKKLDGPERIPFAQRKEFFSYLLEHADDFRPGDVIAIQGRKRDGYIHQHAILIETTDPVTGFPYGLADQMKKPRRRTWEQIMAEAPARSLYYRSRPTERVFRAMDAGPKAQRGSGALRSASLP